MTVQKGYYSLIQYCPDASRLECVNVGLVLFCPEARFIEARTTRGNQRAAQLVGRASLDRASLNSAKRALERRLAIDANAFRTLEDLQRFVDTRGNVLKLSAPRPVKVFDPAADLDKLFTELVGGRARSAIEQEIAPELGAMFHRLAKQGRARLDWTIQVPLVGRRLYVPYAFRNGIWNLVKPQRFPTQEASAIGAAIRLAVEGDLLHKHDEDQLGPKKLIVVSSFEHGNGSQDLESRVEKLLREYNVETVREADTSEYAAQVDKTAHA